MRYTRVRIAIAIDDAGNWFATGWNHSADYPQSETDRRMVSNAREAIEGNVVTHHFIEVNVPLPEPLTIMGELKP